MRLERVLRSQAQRADGQFQAQARQEGLARAGVLVQNGARARRGLLRAGQI